MLMTVISGLHNVSRSVGVALLAVNGGVGLVMAFVGGEIVAFCLFKIMRGDWWYWIRVEGVAAVGGAIVARIMGKIIVDYSGCLIFHHPFEMGGAAFSASIVWAQVMPFVALSMFDGGGEEGLKGDLTCGWGLQ